MLDLYYFPSPNTWKVSIMLEECGLPYRVIPVDIMKGQQADPGFLAVNPNGKVPAMVDADAPGGPITLFESGAILLYLAEKTGRLVPPSGAAWALTLSWLFWQVSGLGPAAGQVHHFRSAAAGSESALARFLAESARLYRVLDAQLARSEFLAREYSIADIACWCWVWFHNMHRQSLSEFPHLDRWFATIRARPAVIRGRKVGLELAPSEFHRLLETGEVQ
jgi:GSH-dependent disulfide-bond oxidoreductase